MKKIFILIICSLLMGAKCNHNKWINDPVPEPFAADDPSWCEAGCAAVKDMKCEEGDDLVYPGRNCEDDEDCEKPAICKSGYCTETCESFCADTINNGRYLGPKCWTEIKECSEIETVCRR